jgi:hypothetical protein
MYEDILRLETGYNTYILLIKQHTKLGFAYLRLIKTGIILYSVKSTLYYTNS